ncbi:MAG TPA: response regulator transcription factor [Chloroflexota bacterium]|nr:response regulator transcription factor [Chloroflexota bacterium]
MLADDHAVFRLGLRGLLEEDEGIRVVAEAETGREAVERAHEFHPDVVVMDARMPDMDGIEATQQIKAELPDTGVLMLSAFSDDEQVLKALEAGASGYLVKGEDVQAVFSAIHNTAAGALHIEPDITQRILRRLVTQGRAEEPPRRSRPDELTEREMNVLQLMAQGKRNRQIADTLGISERTVGNHVNRILRKFQVRDRGQAIMYALRHRLLRL